MLDFLKFMDFVFVIFIDGNSVEIVDSLEKSEAQSTSRNSTPRTSTPYDSVSIDSGKLTDIDNRDGDSHSFTSAGELHSDAVHSDTSIKSNHHVSSNIVAAQNSEKFNNTPSSYIAPEKMNNNMDIANNQNSDERHDSVSRSLLSNGSHHIEIRDETCVSTAENGLAEISETGDIYIFCTS